MISECIYNWRHCRKLLEYSRKTPTGRQNSVVEHTDTHTQSTLGGNGSRQNKKRRAAKTKAKAEKLQLQNKNKSRNYSNVRTKRLKTTINAATEAKTSNTHTKAVGKNTF